MGRNPIAKIPLQVYKPTRVSWTHKLPRNRYLYDPSVKYPIYKRLPAFWRKEFEEKMPLLHQIEEKASRRPQYSGLWKTGEFGEPVPHKTIPVKVIYPPESREGIWGGEGYIVGQRFAHGGDINVEKYDKVWKPRLHRKTLYSEILDREIRTSFTPLALDMIDAAFGFDFFILKTSTKRLQQFGGKLKREMLVALATKNMYPHDPERREEIYKKYKKHAIPLEEAEWVGLTLQEAMQKQWDLEKAKGLHDPVPLLSVYKEELLEKIRLAQEKKEETSEQIQVFEMKDKKQKIGSF